MLRSNPVDGFSLAYDREGEGPPVVLLHGWPGWRADYRDVVPLLREHADVIVPDLRGFGDSDRHVRPPADAYSAEAQAASVLALIDELGVDAPVLVGYDIGSRVARTLALTAPKAVQALVLSPPLPGIGERILRTDEFWYQPFHRLGLADQLLDGRPDAIRAYLTHFWDHWSGPAFTLPAERFDEIVELYARPGAFSASVAWYRSGSAGVATALAERPHRITPPATVLWPAHDPLFPLAWSDRLDEFFDEVELQHVPGIGHYVPLEAPAAVAEATVQALRR